jgi:rhodanese-related sulfurtransferase
LKIKNLAHYSYVVLSDCENKIFPNSLSIPFGELRDNVDKIPVDKPIVVHCTSGNRSAAGSSLIHSSLSEKLRYMI